MLKQIFIDTETTGVNRETCGLYQIAGIIECGKRKEVFNFKFDIFEGCSVDESAFKTNGMSLEKIAQFADPTESYEKFIKLLDKYVDKYDKKDKFTFIAYGAEFDADVLRAWFQRNDDDYYGSWFFHPAVDVMNMAAYHYRFERNQFANFKLKTVAEYMKITKPIFAEESDFHDALFDADITYQMFKQLEKEL